VLEDPFWVGSNDISITDFHCPFINGLMEIDAALVVTRECQEQWTGARGSLVLQEAPLPVIPAELSAVPPPAVSPGSLAPIAVLAEKLTQVADSELAIGNTSDPHLERTRAVEVGGGLNASPGVARSGSVGYSGPAGCGQASGGPASGRPTGGGAVSTVPKLLGVDSWRREDVALQVIGQHLAQIGARLEQSVAQIAVELGTLSSLPSTLVDNAGVAGQLGRSPTLLGEAAKAKGGTTACGATTGDPICQVAERPPLTLGGAAKSGDRCGLYRLDVVTSVVIDTKAERPCLCA